jgi:ABC-2 type transport system permease protein
MNFGFILQRYWLNFRRYIFIVTLSTIVFAITTTLFCLIYPGAEAVQAFVGIPIFQVLTGINNVENPGLLIWIILMNNSLVLSIFYPAIGIFLGVKILPFNEREGKELIFSTSKSLLSYFLENLLIVLVMIPFIAFPAYIIGIGFLLISGGGLTEFTIASIIPIFFVIVIAMVTSLGCSIWSSQKTGYAFGGLFFIISYTLNLLQQEIDFVKDINLMSQINAFPHALAGTWNEEFIFKCLILTVVLIFLTIFFLYRTDYIRTRSTFNELSTKEKSSGILTKFSFIRSPLESILSKVGWKYPAFRDQLQSSAGIFLIYSFITSSLILVIILAYPGDEALSIVFTEMSATLDSPLIAAFMFGHTLFPNLQGFLLLKLMTFHWIYYGPFLFIMTYDIIMRDRAGGYDEITWSMPRTRTQIIIERTIASLVYLWVIVLSNWITLQIGEIILGFFTVFSPIDLGSVTIAFIFIGIGYSIFLILFVTLALIPQPKKMLITLVGAFLIAILIPIIWVMNQELSWLLYFSPFKYFDVAGLLLNDLNLLEEVIPETFIFGIIIIGLFAIIVKFWTPTKDIM